MSEPVVLDRVAAPVPMSILELDAVKSLLDAGFVVIAAGGGGIAVVEDAEGMLKGASAVIDKDLASSLLARQLGAELLVISTAVEKVCLRYGTPQQADIERMTLAEARQYVKEGHFKPGSMLPKIQAVIDYMVQKQTFRAKLQSIGITGLVYVEMGFYDPKETPPPQKFPWQPKELYLTSAPGVASRLGESLDKLLNKMDTDIYPMMANLNKASNDFPALTAKLNEMLPHLTVIAKNVEDITSTGKKYPSQMIFGDAPSKSRYAQ